MQEAHRIQDVGTQSLWFFENIKLLLEPSIIEHRTTGFSRLDKFINNGGPGPKEVFCWLAGTNVGKSIVLCNNAISSFQGPGPGGAVGQDVLLITFELDMIKTGLRCLANVSGVPLHNIYEHSDMILKCADRMQKTYKKRFCIHEMPPDECSVSHIYALLDSFKRSANWHPDVIILDYLDLMISRNPHNNKDDYTSQKHVANEIRGLAKNENVLIFTATQTNRSGSNGAEVADMTKAAESFAKQFSLDYVVSLNQDKAARERDIPQLLMFIAKNRNGPKHETIVCDIMYDRMMVREAL
jgi:replicative DNA helicase